MIFHGFLNLCWRFLPTQSARLGAGWSPRSAHTVRTLHGGFCLWFLRCWRDSELIAVFVAPLLLTILNQGPPKSPKSAKNPEKSRFGGSFLQLSVSAPIFDKFSSDFRRFLHHFPRNFEHNFFDFLHRNFTRNFLFFLISQPHAELENCQNPIQIAYQTDLAHFARTAPIRKRGGEKQTPKTQRKNTENS